MKSVLKLIHQFVPQDEMDQPLARYIGVPCYIKTKKDPHAGFLYNTSLASYKGEKVLCIWEGEEPTKTPKEFLIRHLQKNFQGKVMLRAYPVHPKGASDHIGLLVNEEELVLK